jgi:hypothetical protein
MSKEHSDKSESVKSIVSDDLKLINGIGPAVERRLNGVGIYTFAKLAALPAHDIAKAVAGTGGLTVERITEQDWIGQARNLASKSISDKTQKGVETPTELAFSQTASQVDPATLAAEETLSPSPVVSEPELTSSAIEIVQPTQPGSKKDQILQLDVTMIEPIGAPNLSQIEIVPEDARTPLNCLPTDKPLDIRFTLDFNNTRIDADSQLSYRASIYSKSLEGYPRRIVGETSGIITSMERVTVVIKGIVLPKGIYRLKAFVILNPNTAHPTLKSNLVASNESDLLMIF